MRDTITAAICTKFNTVNQVGCNKLQQQSVMHSMHDSLCVMIDSYVCVMTDSHTCDMTHSYVGFTQLNHLRVT